MNVKWTNDWEQRKLLDCIQKITDFRGRTPKKLGMNWSESGYLALSALNVKDGYIDFLQDVHYGDQALYDKWMTGNELHKGQVLFTTEAPMGNVAQIPDNRRYILSQRTIAFDVKPELIIENFLAIVLRTPTVFASLTALSSGGTAKGVSQKSLATVEITIPVNLNEQEQLASIFSIIDHLITLHQWKCYFYEIIRLNDWEQRKLLDCIQKITDFRGRTPKKLGMNWSESGYLALSALNVKDGYIDFLQDVHYGDQALYDKWMTGNELHKGQVLFTTEAPMGNVAQIPDNRRYILSQRTIAFDVKPELIIENFLAIVLRTPTVFASLTALSSGGTAKGVSQKSLATVEITIPVNLNEQEQLASIFSIIDHLITLHQWKCYFYEIIRLNDWEQRKLGDIVDVCSGRDYKHLEEGNIPVYGTGGYMLSVNEALSDDEDAIGIGRKGTIDNPYILRAPFWTVDTLFYAVPRKNYDLEFVFSIFQNINWKAKDESTGVPSLSKTTINAVKTMISDYDEQKKIGQYFSELDRLITLHQRKYILYKNIKSDTEKQRKLCESEENLRQRH